MRITVTPIDIHPAEGHPEPHSGRGEPIIGKHSVIVHARGVWLDGVQVIAKDRRAKKNRQVGHPWLTSRRRPNDNRFEINWTSFTVEVET